MSDDHNLVINPQTIPGYDQLSLTNVVGLYVELANKVVQHTQLSSQKLTKIIDAAHRANQAV